VILNIKNIDLNKNLLNNFFLILFCFIPVAILIGPAISLSNILTIILIFLLLFLNKNSFFLLKKKTIFLLIFLYFYLIFNSLISINFDIGAVRNFGFIRYIILFIALNYFFLICGNINKLFNFWILIFSIVLFDIIYEFYNGQNILGFESNDKKRIVSFFKDESIVGAFINGFFFILIGFIFKNYEKKNNIEKFLIYFFIVLTVSCIIFTGERSNTLKFFLGLSIFFWLNNKIKLNYKLFFAITIISIFFISFFQFTEIRHRYQNDILQKITDQETRKNYIYFKLYNSGLEVFKKYPFFGVGNKNYRVETCGVQNKTYICNSHPHQIYIEFLSEHGIIGTIILLSILFYLLFKHLKIILLNRNLIQIGCFSYLITIFIPVLPGGSFFSDFNATIFWINFSLFYASNLNTNIFNKFHKLN